MAEPKADLVRSWLIKSSHDLGSAKRLAQEPAPYFDTALYHCQQAAEKALKAFLVYHDQELEKSHNLTSLTDLCTEIDREFQTLLDAAANLTPYATAYRYPDEFFEEEPSKEEFDKHFNKQIKFWSLLASACQKKFSPNTYYHVNPTSHPHRPHLYPAYSHPA